MKRWIVGLTIAALSVTGVAYAADAVAPTLADVYKAVVELKADVAQLKADGFTKANASGKLATAASKDGKVTVEVTSLMSGPDAAVMGVKITNSGASSVKIETLLGTTVTAAGQKIEILAIDGFTGGVLPNTSAAGVILTKPLPKDATDVVLRTKVFDGEKYSTIMEPALTVKAK